MRPDDLSNIHNAFADDGLYIDSSGENIEITIVEFNVSGDDPFGEGNSVRQKGFEIPYDQLPERPNNGEHIKKNSKSWRIIDVVDYDEANVWRVMVEKA